MNLHEDQAHDIVDIADLMNPFPGLRPFGIEEGHLFFGREGQSDEVLVKLAENKFVGILGASGSGKSSFMYCGLIPSLVGGFMTEAGSNWRVVVARPGGGPIDNLAEALLIKDKAYKSLSEEDKLIRKTIIGTVLRSSSLGLVEVVKQLKTEDDQNILIVIDQFEELFRFRKLEAATSDMDESSAFVNLLLEAIHQFEEPIYVTITMRSDFIGECAKFPDLTQMINDSHYLIPQMTRDQKRTAIEGPVAVGGGKIAPRLTQQLLNDVGDNPDQLPILQHALMRTWANWVETRKKGEFMDLRHYNAIGTLREALSQHANEAYDSLSRREKEICEVMFKSLTERGNENQGIRRPTKLGTIAAIAGVTEDEVIRVVDKFREPGRSLLMPPYGIRLDSDTVVDISHESLMRIWDRLKRWLDEESKAAEMYLKLSEAAERFQEGKASLWKMPDLQLALNWREENRPTLVWGQRYNPAFERTMVFLETSEKAYLTEQRNKELLQKRQVRRMQMTAVILGIAALVCIFFVVLAQFNSIEAQEKTKEALLQKENADKERAKADSLKLLANAESVKAKDQENKALEALDDAKKANALAEEKTLEAIKSADEAKANQIKAEKAQKDSDANAERATVEADNAKKAKEAADKLRMQSIAQSMAIKAATIDERELKAVVAKQAYDYFMEYGDPAKPYNGDVYAGIYDGLSGILTRYRIDSVGKTTVKVPLNNGDSVLNQYHGHASKNTEVGVRSVVFSKDGTKMFSAGSDGRILKWDYAGGKRSYSEILNRSSVNRVVNIGPNERYLALGTTDDQILVVDLKKADAEPISVKGHNSGTIFDLVFMPEEGSFISSGADNRVLLNNIKNGTTTEIYKTAKSSDRPRTLAISPDGKRLAVGLTTGEVISIDLTSSKYESTRIASTLKMEPVMALAYNPDGSLLAIGDISGTINIWNLKDKRREGPKLTGFSSEITDVQFNRTGRLIVGTSKDKTARMWDMENIYDLPTVYEDHKGWVWSLSFNPQKDVFATSCADGIIRVFETLPGVYADQICGLIHINMNETQWKQYVADPSVVPYELTCDELPKGVDEIE